MAIFYEEVHAICMFYQRGTYDGPKSASTTSFIYYNIALRIEMLSELHTLQSAR